ncbi:MAG TPA: nucleotide sugar dehydrogenase [Acidiferrobacteraceae bacterium]|nr:nucleotide sugar dehydrogenase [Acidiferrobacteraceae bacterium]
MNTSNPIIGVIGLGYVGLPLAVAFGNRYPTIGYDSNIQKVSELKENRDSTGEVSEQELKAAIHFAATTDPALLSEADFIIIAVPTPVDNAHRPDFGPLISASKIAGKHMKGGATVVFESTVYPGATEEVCLPELELQSGMKWKNDFYIAYSPERINPGDKEHTLRTITKLVAADTPETLDATARLYEAIVDAGVYRVSSIKVAEAAKVIENTQRDLNIALINELAIIFNHLDIDTVEVLEAAGSKWNFLPFRPGLVGGHCIGVDPYYLTHKAQMLGYHPQVILAGRHINDNMGKHIAEQTIKMMIKSGCQIKDNKVIVLGLTFKENCPDLRNSQVMNVIRELREYGVDIVVHDAMADPDEAKREYGVQLTEWDALPLADAIVVTVAHQPYLEKSVAELAKKLRPGACFIDVKSAFNQEEFEDKGINVWRL